MKYKHSSFSTISYDAKPLLIMMTVECKEINYCKIYPVSEITNCYKSKKKLVKKTLQIPIAVLLSRRLELSGDELFSSGMVGCSFNVVVQSINI